MKKEKRKEEKRSERQKRDLNSVMLLIWMVFTLVYGFQDDISVVRIYGGGISNAEVPNSRIGENRWKWEQKRTSI